MPISPSHYGDYPSEVFLMRRVFPTGVGIDLRDPLGLTAQTRFPHGCGDEPAILAVFEFPYIRGD